MDHQIRNSYCQSILHLALTKPFTDPIDGYDRSLVYTTDSASTDCSSISVDCVQIHTFTVQGCGAVEFTGSGVELTFDVLCKTGTTPDGANCAEPADATVKITADLTTTNACPIEEKFAIKNLALKPYQESTHTTARTLFGSSQKVFFGVEFDLPPATISNKGITVESVCAYAQVATSANPLPPCLNAKKVPSAKITTDGAVKTGSGDNERISFYVKGEDLKTAAGVTDVNTNGVITPNNDITVQVDVTIQYDGFTSKRSVVLPNYAALSHLSIVDIVDDAEQPQIEEVAYPSSSARLTILSFVGLVLFLIVA